MDKIIVDIAIKSIASAGEGVGRLPDGRVAFVPHAIPGDWVRVQTAYTRKKVVYAELLQVLSASPGRILSRCGEEMCGGCPWRYSSLMFQHEQKALAIGETLRRLGNIILPTTLILTPKPLPAAGWGLRHRVRLHAAWQPMRGWLLGYHQRQSHVVLPFHRCPVIFTELEQLVKSITQALIQLPEQCALTTLTVCWSQTSRRGAVAILSEGPLQPLIAPFLLPQQGGSYWEVTQKAGLLFANGREQCAIGNIRLEYDHGQAAAFALEYEPDVFTQATPVVNDALVAAVVARVAPDKHCQVVELFAGIGNFSIPLARAGAEVIAFEVVSKSARLHASNAAKAAVAIKIQALPALKAFPLAAATTVVVLDPPHSGAAAEIAQLLAGALRPQLVYISCHLGALARDLKTLMQAGYRIAYIEAFDMFPQTPLAEVLVDLRYD